MRYKLYVARYRKMFPQNHTHNAYLVSYLKTLKSEFLDQNDFERMIEAKNAEEALHVLNETHYGQYLGDLRGPEDFDVVLNEGLEGVKDLILKLFSRDKDLRFLWLKYDFLNLKSLIKLKFQGENAQLNNLGTIELDVLREVILEGIKKELPYNLNGVIREVLKTYEKNQDPQEIDLILDRKYIEVLIRELARIKSRILKDFLRREIDLFNVKIYFRIRGEEGKEADFIPGGLIPLRRFKISNEDKFVKSIDDLEEQAEFKHLEEQVEKEGLLSLELAARRILFEILEKAQNKILGIEPVFAFWQAKVEETKLIHKILTLKNAGIVPAEIHRLIGS